MFKKLLWGLLGVLLVAPIVASIAGIKFFQLKAMEASAAAQVVPPEAINTADVREEQWQPRVASVGSVVAVQGTIVSTEADGVVREIVFEAGSNVKKGDPLVQLDVEIEKAQLREAEATSELARVSFTRSKDLVQSKNIPQAEYDTAAVNLMQAVARLDNIKALIAKKVVIAPFAGRLGIREISVGQFLQKGSPVVSLQSLDPIYVEFSLPQQRLGELAEGLEVSVTSDAYTSQTFEGKISAINPNIDPATRNVRVQATMPNGDGKLRPGMFASVDVLLSNTETVLFIPETAVIHAPFGDSVYVVEQATKTAEGATSATDGKAMSAEGTTPSLVIRQQFVRLGTRQGDFVVATEGLKAGQTIVSTGVFKLRPGIAVVVDNTLAPDFKLQPFPKNT